MMVCSFNTDSLLGNEQRFKFKGKVPFIYLPWSPLSPLRPSRPSLPGTPLCPGSPGMPGCPQTQPLACVCSCATHLAIQRSSSRVRIHLTCNIAIIAHRIKVRRSRPRVKPYWIVNGWNTFRWKNPERSTVGQSRQRPNWTGTLDKRGLEALSLAWMSFFGLLIELSVIHHQCLSRIVKANNNRLWAHVKHKRPNSLFFLLPFCVIA